MAHCGSRSARHPWLPGRLADASVHRCRERAQYSVAIETEAPAANGRSALFGYAVLRANFDHNAPSYLDNFSAFILDALAERHPDSSDEAVIGQKIRETFGFTIPDRVVGQLLRKLTKAKKVIAQEGGSYHVEESALKGLVSLRESMAKFESQQIELVTKFTNFVTKYHRQSFNLIAADPGFYLHAFIEGHAAPLLRRGVTGQPGHATPLGEMQGPEYLVGAFVLHLEGHDAATFGYLINAVKGAILAGVLVVGPGDLRLSLNHLTLVLDTPVLLSALGYQGTLPQRAAGQMLQLAHDLGARLECFGHTEKEISGVLDAAIVTLRRPERPPEGWSAVATHFASIGATPADIVIAQHRLRTDLQALRLNIRSHTNDYHRYGLDETLLEGLLERELPAQRLSTRRYDLQSISALHRLRKHNRPDTFERCGYVFVTDNSGLVVVARQIDEGHHWPLVMLEGTVASLLWVRGPAIGEDLPRQQLLAAVYTGMQPASHLWMKYVEEIERLESRGTVNTDEAVVLRSRPEARDVLMDVTLGDTTMINAESMELIVDRVREHINSPDRDGVHSASAGTNWAENEAPLQRQVDELQAKLSQLEVEHQVRNERVKRHAARRAHQVVLAPVIVATLALVAAVVVKTVDPGLVQHLPVWLAIVITTPVALVAALGCIRMFVKGTILDWFVPIERRLAARIERRSRASEGLPPQRDE